MCSRRKPITDPWADASSLLQGSPEQHENFRALKKGIMDLSVILQQEQITLMKVIKLVPKTQDVLKIY